MSLRLNEGSDIDYFRMTTTRTEPDMSVKADIWSSASRLYTHGTVPEESIQSRGTVPASVKTYGTVFVPILIHRTVPTSVQTHRTFRQYIHMKQY